jgi:hypothetical protein
MRQEILKGALLIQHREAGLKLTHPYGHLLCLETSGGTPICYFNSVTATIEQVRKVADCWMLHTDAISYVGANNGCLN